MKLYLLSQDKNTGRNTYDRAVVAAESQLEAVFMHPEGFTWHEDYEQWRQGPKSMVASFSTKAISAFAEECWATPDRVGVVLLGDAIEGIAKGVICASFNAG